jgi:hypothetical protein
MKRLFSLHDTIDQVDSTALGAHSAMIFAGRAPRAEDERKCVTGTKSHVWSDAGQVAAIQYACFVDTTIFTDTCASLAI